MLVLAQRGVRAKAITDELSGEKIDVIEWSKLTHVVSLPQHFPQQRLFLVELNEVEKKLVTMSFLDENFCNW